MAAEEAHIAKADAQIAAEKLCRNAVGLTGRQACRKAQVKNIMSRENPRN